MRDMSRTADSLVSQLKEADQASMINEQRTLREDFYRYVQNLNTATVNYLLTSHLIHEADLSVG